MQYFLLLKQQRPGPLILKNRNRCGICFHIHVCFSISVFNCGGNTDLQCHRQIHQPDFSHFILTETTAGYLISGRIRFSIGEESFEAESGDRLYFRQYGASGRNFRELCYRRSILTGARRLSSAKIGLSRERIYLFENPELQKKEWGSEVKSMFPILLHIYPDPRENVHFRDIRCTIRRFSNLLEPFVGNVLFWASRCA